MFKAILNSLYIKKFEIFGGHQIANSKHLNWFSVMNIVCIKALTVLL